MDKITREYWKLKLQDSLLTIVLLSIFFGIIIYAVISGSSKVISTEIVTGELVSFHQMQSDEGAIRSVFFIKLNNGNTVRVFPPPHATIKINQQVELVKREKESGKVSYEFKRYSGGN